MSLLNFSRTHIHIEGRFISIDKSLFASAISSGNDEALKYQIVLVSSTFVKNFDYFWRDLVLTELCKRYGYVMDESGPCHSKNMAKSWLSMVKSWPSHDQVMAKSQSHHGQVLAKIENLVPYISQFNDKLEPNQGHDKLPTPSHVYIVICTWPSYRNVN